jgi:hypothetical protein
MPKLTFALGTGFRFKDRGIGFLTGDEWLNAQHVFDGLPEKAAENVRNRIDHWLSGGVFDKYHHGWPNAPKHDQCYVFKYQSPRFYGFLCNPKPSTHGGFRLCVLTECLEKHKWNTESAVLDRAMRLRDSAETIAAIGAIYPEYLGGKAWIN